MKRVSTQCGATLVEVLIAMFLLSLVIVPAILALQTSVVGANVHSDAAQVHYRLSSQVERVLSEPFASLETAAAAAGSASTPTSYSEAPGVPGRLLVYIAPFDGDDADSDGQPFTGADDGILWVRVHSEGTPHAIESLATRGP